MSFRVTQQFAGASAREHISRQTSELFQVQQQISSGLRMQRPSDDPAGTRRSLIQKDRVERLNAQTTSLQHVRSRLEQAHVQLRGANDLILRSRNIALSAPQVREPAEIQALATELTGILEQMESIANASDESGYLFSGTAAQTKPFPDGIGQLGVSKYAGTSASTELSLTGDVKREALIPGDSIFQGTSRGATLVIGSTGVASGSGTDTARGMRELLVTHGITTFAPGSGVSAGTSSASSDTIIGGSGVHSLQIVDTSGNGSFGTISLNGGDAVAYSGTDTDLMVTGNNGEKVYVNTTAITPGFSGNIALTATGAISIDGGLTSTVIDFTASQTVTDSRDGSMVFLDTSSTTRAGTDQLEFVGTSDVFAAIADLRNDLLNSRNLSVADRNASLNRRIGELERVQTHVLDMVGMQSVSMEQLDRLKTRTEELALAEKVELSETVSTDITQAILRLQELQNLQQFTLAAVTKVLTPNLLNYLQ